MTRMVFVAVAAIAASVLGALETAAITFVAPAVIRLRRLRREEPDGREPNANCQVGNGATTGGVGCTRLRTFGLRRVIVVHLSPAVIAL
jgi:hypothetical protein